MKPSNTISAFWNSENNRYKVYLALWVAIGFYPVWMGIYHLKYDFFDYYYPYRYFIGNSLRNGVFPLWMPYQEAGLPLIADPQSGLWYPITWVTGLLFKGKLIGWQIEFVFHMIVAATGFYNLGQYFVKNSKASFVIALGFALGGFFIGNAQHYTFVVSGAWIPLILLHAFKMYSRLTIADALKTALFSMFLITGGYPAFTMIMLYVMLLLFTGYLVKYLIQYNKTHFLKFIKVNITASLVTILLCGGFILSVIQSGPLTFRGEGIDLETALSLPFPPKALVSLLAPFATVVKSYETFHSDMSMINAYMGLFVMVFSLAFLFRKKQPRISYVFLAVSLLFLFISFGEGFYLRKWLYLHVPLMDYFRFPSIFRYFYILSYLLFAGYAIKAFIDEGALKKSNKVATVVLMLAMAIAVAIVAKNHYLQMPGFIKNGLFLQQNNATMAQHAVFQLMVQILFLAIFVGVSWLKKEKALIIPVFLGLVIADMLLSSRLNSHFTVFYDDTRFKEYKEYESRFPEGYPDPARETVIQTDDGDIYFGHYWKNLNIFQKQISYNSINPVKLINYKQLRDSLPELFNLCLSNKAAYLSGDIRPVGSLLSNLEEGTATPKTIFLEEKDFNAYNNKAGQTLHGDTARFIEFGPNRAIVETRNQNPVFMVIVQNYYPGWKARVNGYPASIIKANKTFMAVLVPAGENRVEFTFRPRLALVGLWVGLLTLLTVFILLWVKPFFIKLKK
jgi:hypothetical protein